MKVQSFEQEYLTLFMSKRKKKNFPTHSVMTPPAGSLEESRQDTAIKRMAKRRTMIRT